MNLLAIALLIVHVSHGNCYYSKCCKIGENLIEVNSTYSCIENKLRRLYVLTNESNFFRNNFDGKCVDVSTDFFIFKYADGKVVDKRPITEKIFPKCCPLNYSYNSILHACEESTTDVGFVNEHFVRVGLPSCKIIVDYELSSVNEIYKRKFTSSASYCIDRTEKATFIYRECQNNVDICKDIKCIKKCCPDGQSFINKSQCYDTYTNGLNLSTFSMVASPEERYAIISNRVCSSIYMMNEESYTFRLNKTGVFELWQKKLKRFVPYEVTDMKSYCIEHTKTPKMDKYMFFMCFPEVLQEKKFMYTLWAKILSIVFLVITVLIYVILRETRNLYGKLLINYCVSLFCENGILIYVQMSLLPSATNCVIRAFSIIFFATSSFTWSNAICYDIYRTFGSMRRTIGKKKNNLNKLLLYLLYGWGVPAILTALVAVFYKNPVLPHSIQPYLAVLKCFFDKKPGNYAQILFLNLPHLIIQIINTVFFIKTSVYCIKVKNEINKIKDTTVDERNKRYQKEKEKLLLILKLSVIMGISFGFEIVSACFDMKEMGTTAMYVEIIWDTINCLQGFFIFIIFICKRKIYNDLMRKFNIGVPRNLSFSSASTQTTASSRQSKKSLEQKF